MKAMKMIMMISNIENNNINNVIMKSNENVCKWKLMKSKK